MSEIAVGLSRNGLALALGLGASFALMRLMKDFLFSVEPNDPLTFGMGALSLTVVALIASYVQARWATKVGAITSLRCE